MNVLSIWVFLGSELWLDLESVSTEVISLSLEEVGWEILGTVTIEPRQSSAESWGWNAHKSSLGNNISPSWLGLVDGLVEEVVEQQVLQVIIGTVSSGDVLEENGSDNASTSPHQSNGWLVKLPLEFLGSLKHC